MKAETVLTVACWFWSVVWALMVIITVLAGKGVYSGYERINAELYELSGKGSIRWLLFVASIWNWKTLAWILAVAYLMFKYEMIVW